MVRKLFGTVLMIGLGLVFVYGGMSLHKQQTAFPDGIAATATVTGADVGESDEGGKSKTSVYTFRTADGRDVTFRDPVSGAHQLAVGSTVPISYRADAPEDARILRGWDWTALLFTGVGVLLAGFGVVQAVRTTLIAVGWWRTGWWRLIW